MSANVPASLVAGDTWSWTAEFPDNAAPAWVVTFFFQNASGTFQVAAAASGANHLATFAASATADFNSGRYRWRARAVNGLTSKTLEEGWLEVLADPSSGKLDLRSTPRKLLDAVEAALTRRATSDQLAMTLGSRSISRTPLPELLQWRDRLREEVATEEKGDKAGNGRKLKTRFGRG